ncbi:MAG: glutamine synthetase III [Oscillospiraceae bacterium]|nr:glutamine synthetase III [Oscillospiraceae bacterium]
MKDIPKYFGSMVFNDAVMEDMLPNDIYNALRKTMSQGTHLELDVAHTVANAMKDWAVEKGATHFTHWFQPMTGTTAEKHNSFLTPSPSGGGGRSGDGGADGSTGSIGGADAHAAVGAGAGASAGGGAIMAFSGKELVRGESDASAFPSGGLRATFEARGYTVWDITSYAFIKNDTLYIPTAFCTYGGESLDKKTPLLRSMQALNKQALRILRLFGNTSARRVNVMLGAEQEFFLIDKKEYLRRPDLINTGRTLLGAKPPKGQELNDHYFGSLKPRVAAFMKELEEHLWLLGVFVETKHNEVAPGQHELVPKYTIANIAADQNQLIMDLMKSTADRHGLACLLHEKPFAGINGSGKHNNWSLCADTGANLLDPGVTPYENAQFLLFLTALMKAVDEYQDLLRASVASAGNDHRLGAHEAPPAIVSMFLGDELTEILDAIEADAGYTNKEAQQMQIGVTVLPHIPKDATDRNRTSPFAYTGSKFEFRMLGAPLSIAEPIIALNTAVAEALRQFADQLETSERFEAELATLIKQTYSRHKRIAFNGNNYADEWADVAQKRGLSNLAASVDSIPEYISDKSIELFERQGVFSRTELMSRYEIFIESYCKTLHIEALTMVDMLWGMVVPASVDYQGDLSGLLRQKMECGTYDTSMEDSLLAKIAGLSTCVMDKLAALENALVGIPDGGDTLSRAKQYRDTVCTAMADLRLAVDGLEPYVPKKYWRMPSYADLLNSVI